ncbi:glycosyltransferase [Iamia sp. SCSIO 61187]|uniref:glycosyltransferase n=1 Tax=Iamia sp. SCSIO 61187 TaxID=2722752 RepID=UPI001C6290B7|nr:glycosyltransferase [Iamia sp. SCSIO 61187]
MFDRYDALTTPAVHLTAAMNQHFPTLRRPFTTLPIGVDDAFAHGRPDPVWRSRLPDGAAVGVCVGRLIASKNQAAVIDAVASLSAVDRDRLGILLVGSGPAERELRQRVADAGLEDRVVLVGQISRARMPDLLASVDFGLFPTLSEASSVAAAEALAAGLPIVHLDIPSMRETVDDAGIIAAPGGLATAMLSMADRHADLAPIARRRGAGSLMSVVRECWMDLYSGVVAGDP